MIATISPSPLQYHHTVNTLKYADRAKEIKTHVRRNQGTVQEHVSRLRHVIAALQKENVQLKAALNAPKVRGCEESVWRCRENSLWRPPVPVTSMRLRKYRDESAA